MVSLRTRRYREAEHLAAVADLAFASLWQRAVSQTTDDADLKRVLRECIRQRLDEGVHERLSAPPGRPLYVRNWDGELPPAHADLEAVDETIENVREDLIDRDFTRVMDEVDSLIEKHSLAGDVRQRLALGVLEAKLQYLGVLRDRVLGRPTHSILPASEPAGSAALSFGRNDSPSPPKPLASELVEGFMEDVALNGVRGQTKAQTEASVRLFIKAVGDRPIDTYTGADGQTYWNALRQLPSDHHKLWQG